MRMSRGVWMLLTDIPYLQPLTLWLQDDETLKEYFTVQSFFMPHNNLVEAIADAEKNKDCFLPNALWILPGDTTTLQRRAACRSQGNHSFKIAIMTHCMGGPFFFRKLDDGSFELAGQFMELARMRKLVKDSVHRFAAKVQTQMGLGYIDLVWVADQNIYPNEQNSNLIATSISFEIKLNNQ